MLELRKWIIFMVLLPLGTQWQEANMHRGPGERAGGSGPAWRSPARTDTLAHAPSRTPGCGSAPGQRRRRAPAATHAWRPGRGGRVPPSLPSLASASASPAPFPASARRARSCASLRPGWRAEDAPRPRPWAGAPRTPSHARGAAGGGGRDAWRWWPECPGSGLLRRRRRCVRLGPAASSLLAAIALAPGHARPCPGSPTRPAAPGSSRPQGPDCGWGVEGQPDLHPQGGFHHGRGLLDQGRTPPLPKVA